MMKNIYKFIGALTLTDVYFKQLNTITMEQFEKICNLFEGCFLDLIIDDFFTKLSGMGGM